MSYIEDGVRKEFFATSTRPLRSDEIPIKPIDMISECGNQSGITGQIFLLIFIIVIILVIVIVPIILRKKIIAMVSNRRNGKGKPLASSERTHDTTEVYFYHI